MQRNGLEATAAALGLMLLGAVCWRFGIYRAETAPPVLRRLPEERLRRAYPSDTLRTLKEAPEFTLYSTQGSQWTDDEKPARFHNHAVVGTTVVTGDEKRVVLEALLSGHGVVPNDGRHPIISASCFNPRHGIRARHPQTGRVVDLHLCFSCGNGKVYSSDGTEEWLPGDAFGPPLKYHLDRVFRERGVKVAP